MLNGLYWYSAFLVPTAQSTLPHSPINKHIHTLMAEAAMQKKLTCSSGAIQHFLHKAPPLTHSHVEKPSGGALGFSILTGLEAWRRTLLPQPDQSLQIPVAMSFQSRVKHKSTQYSKITLSPAIFAATAVGWWTHCTLLAPHSTADRGS